MVMMSKQQAHSKTVPCVAWCAGVWWAEGTGGGRDEGRRAEGKERDRERGWMELDGDTGFGVVWVRVRVAGGVEHQALQIGIRIYQWWWCRRSDLTWWEFPLPKVDTGADQTV